MIKTQATQLEEGIFAVHIRWNIHKMYCGLTYLLLKLEKLEEKLVFVWLSICNTVQENVHNVPSVHLSSANMPWAFLWVDWKWQPFNSAHVVATGMAGELYGGSLGLPQPTSMLGGGGGSVGKLMQLLVCIHNAWLFVQLERIKNFLLYFCAL